MKGDGMYNELTRGIVAEIEALRAECEALRKDAERYRWLTTEQKTGTMVFFWNQKYSQPYASIRGNITVNVMGHFDSIDAAIDAAIAKEAP